MICYVLFSGTPLNNAGAKVGIILLITVHCQIDTKPVLAWQLPFQGGYLIEK